MTTGTTMMARGQGWKKEWNAVPSTRMSFLVNTHRNISMVQCILKTHCNISMVQCIHHMGRHQAFDTYK